MNKDDKNTTYIDFEAEASVEHDNEPYTPPKPRHSRSLNSKSAAVRAKSSSAGRRPAPGKKITGGQKAGTVLAVIGTTALTIMLIAVITVCIVAVALTVYVMQFAENSFEIDLKQAELSFTSTIMAYDRNAGEEGQGDWVEVKRVSSDENRTWVDYEDIPQILIDAIVANEDHRFFEHEGVDWYGTAGVIFTAAFSSNEDIRGASTITQQLVKNVTGDDKVSAGRKLREIFRALSLEQKYTKLDILESYMNRIGFGGTSYGIGSAAWYYFDKDVSELTIAECALLAGVIPSPHHFNPYNNAENAKSVQTLALNQMYKNGFITRAEYLEALAEPVRFRRPIAGEHFGYVDERYNEWYGLQSGADDGEDLYFENTSWDDIRTDIPYVWNGDYEVTQSWYVDAGIWQVADHISKQRGVTYEKALEQIRSGGYTIYLNVDLDMQARLEEVAANPLNFIRAEYPAGTSSEDALQGAFVIMDYMGRVVALAGGFGEKPGDNCFNRATQAVRAIGSTVKPISVYAPAVDMNVITYSTMTKDVSGQIYKIPGHPDSGTERWPYNFEETTPGSGRYLTSWFAVMRSYNTIAVRTLQKVGFQASYSMLVDRLGFTDLDPARDMNWSPLALGAFTNGVRLHELAAAFQVFGNGGIYYEPYLYDRVLDHNGKVILEQNLTGTQALDGDSAWIVNRMMKKVTDDPPPQTGTSARVENHETIGKTGTSNDMKNILFVGLTPEYVAAYRIGFDDGGKEMKAWSGDNWNSTARVWGNTMNHVVDNSEVKNFPPDASVLELPYCTQTGHLATSRCPSTEIGFFKQAMAGRPPSCDSRHDGSDYWAIEGNGDPAGFIPTYS